MAKKRTAAPPAASAAPERPGVTAERFGRLVLLLRLLSEKSLTREALTRRLKMDVRGFYRDLGLVRGAGIGVELAGGRYHLSGDLKNALGLLPFPDPHLTLAEATALAKGRTAAHAKLRDLLERARP